MKIINYDILCTYCDFHAFNWVCTSMQSCCRSDMFIYYAQIHFSNVKFKSCFVGFEVLMVVCWIFYYCRMWCCVNWQI